MTSGRVSIQRNSVHQFPRSDKSSRRYPGDYARYGLWLLLANTANANRRQFGLPTTWVLHLFGNSIALLLPELIRATDGLLTVEKDVDDARQDAGAWPAIYATLQELVVGNPDYVKYVAPTAAAYIVSHPRFNIYRGAWAELTWWGFGLDTIPHAATAYAFTRAVYDTLDALAPRLDEHSALHPYVTWAAAHRRLVTGSAIALLTLAYETGEFLIHRQELAARDHDVNRINMMWGLKDSIFDGISNAIGWAVAILRLAQPSE